MALHLIINCAILSLTIISVSMANAARTGNQNSHGKRNQNGHSHRNQHGDSISSESKFAWSLYQSLIATTSADQNVVISPFSAYAALTIAAYGARGVTRMEMEDILGIPLVKGLKDRGNQFLLMNMAHENCVLQSVNGLFLDTNFQISQAYREDIRLFGANISTVDFQRQPENARTQINTFVEEKTKKKVQELFPPGSIGSDTQLIIVNAVYFKADWEKEFDLGSTLPGTFFLTNGQNKTVQLMTLVGKVMYGETQNAQILELKYKKGNMSMVIILPKAEASLTLIPDMLKDGLPSFMVHKKVVITIPKFKVSKRYDLSSNLQHLGMRSAFSHQANFSGISDSNQGRGLTISRIEQKVFVEVDEKGTEAAAATGIQIVMLSAISEPEIPVFRADRPFLYMIRHNPTKSIIVMGRVADPSSE